MCDSALRSAWPWRQPTQAQLSTKAGGIGLRVRSLEGHSSAAFVASYIASMGLSAEDDQQQLRSKLEGALAKFNTLVLADSQLSASRSQSLPLLRQGSLSARIEARDQQQLLESASPADRVRLEAIAADNASAWMRAVPSPGLGLAIPPDVMSVLVKWWLGLPVSPLGQVCPRCPTHALDQAGHHALTCKRGPHITARHKALRDCLAQYCRRALLSPSLEEGAGLNACQTRPADILLPTWTLGAPAALDLTVVHPLNTKHLTGASMNANPAALRSAVDRKHAENNAKCQELGWTCLPVSYTHLTLPTILLV